MPYNDDGNFFKIMIAIVAIFAILKIFKYYNLQKKLLQFLLISIVQKANKTFCRNAVSNTLDEIAQCCDSPQIKTLHSIAELLQCAMLHPPCFGLNG